MLDQMRPNAGSDERSRMPSLRSSRSGPTPLRGGLPASRKRPPRVRRRQRRVRAHAFVTTERAHRAAAPQPQAIHERSVEDHQVRGRLCAVKTRKRRVPANSVDGIQRNGRDSIRRRASLRSSSAACRAHGRHRSPCAAAARSRPRRPCVCQHGLATFEIGREGGEPPTGITEGLPLVVVLLRALHPRSTRGGLAAPHDLRSRRRVAAAEPPSRASGALPLHPGGLQATVRTRSCRSRAPPPRGTRPVRASR